MYAIERFSTLADCDSDVRVNTGTRDTGQESAGIIQRLKDDFGDYKDPLMYDWSWREPEAD